MCILLQLIVLPFIACQYFIPLCLTYYADHGCLLWEDIWPKVQWGCLLCCVQRKGIVHIQSPPCRVNVTIFYTGKNFFLGKRRFGLCRHQWESCNYHRTTLSPSDGTKGRWTSCSIQCDCFVILLCYYLWVLWPAGRSEDGVFGRGSEETLNCMTMLYCTVIMAWTCITEGSNSLVGASSSDVKP